MSTVAPSALPSVSPLALRVRRVSGGVVGRPAELAAIRQELAAARQHGLAAVTLEGEPGIGKTRLVLAAVELAEAEELTPVAVTADEELRGPFLVARSILAAACAASSSAEVREAVQRALDAVSGRPEPGLENLPLDRQLLRAFDLAALALAALAAERPVALLVDDLQWADEDSLRLLRYLVRANAASPIFMLLAIRPEELAFVNEAVTLVADMERVGLVRRLKLSRFTQLDTRELLKQIFGADVDPSSAAAMHAQAEGVPFIVEELAQTYRDAGMIQQIDGVWKLAKNAERLVPSAVRTLIQRRAARLPEATKASLAEAAIVGRSFSLRDLLAVKTRLGDDCELGILADAMSPAVDTGLLVPHPEDSPADYSFAHDQIREFASASLTPPRRRAIHAAIVEILSAGGDPPPESLPLLTQHALAAGDTIRCTRFSCQAAQHALAARAPEEVLRVVELGLPAASDAKDRIALLKARDDALDMLRRAGDRVEGLTELAALADALGDTHLRFDVMLRRAAALRLSGQEDQAIALARRVRDEAAGAGDRAAELGGCLELGQACLRTELGEGFSPTGAEVDLEAAEEAFRRAVELARELGDDAALAAALRELGTVVVAKVRDWFVDQIRAGRQFEFLQRLTSGETIEQMLMTFPIAPMVHEAHQLYVEALDVFDRLGDRRGVVSALIAMAYINWAPQIHLTSSARYIEEIRRMFATMGSLTKESERLNADIQMLYGVHVYSRAKVVPDLALSRGEECYRVARAAGDRTVEFLAAGGVASVHLELGDIGEAERWLDLAAAAASAAPTALRARQMESLRGVARAAAGDAAAARQHLERAVALATDQGQAAGRCEALARLAVEMARLGAERRDEELLAVAERAADEVRDLVGLLPGHPPWGAQADAAVAHVALARGDVARAVDAARSAMSFFLDAKHEDLNLEIVLPVARALVEGGSDDERAFASGYVYMTLTAVAQRTLDEDVRVRWFRGPWGRALAAVSGEPEAPAVDDGDRASTALEGLTDQDQRLLRLLIEGRTNREIAAELDMDEDALARALAETFARIGASSRSEATVFAFAQKVV